MRRKLAWACAIVAGGLLIVASLLVPRLTVSFIAPLVIAWLAATALASACFAGLLADTEQRWTVPLLVTTTVAGASLVAIGAVSIANASAVLSANETGSGSVLMFPVPASGLLIGGIAVYGLLRPGPMAVAETRTDTPVLRRVVGMLMALGALAVLSWAVLVLFARLDRTGLVTPLLVAASILVATAAAGQLDRSGSFGRPRRVVQFVAGLVLGALGAALLLGTGALPPSEKTFWLGVLAFGAGVAGVVAAVRHRSAR